MFACPEQACGMCNVCAPTLFTQARSAKSVCPYGCMNVCMHVCMHAYMHVKIHKKSVLRQTDIHTEKASKHEVGCSVSRTHGAMRPALALHTRMCGVRAYGSVCMCRLSGGWLTRVLESQARQGREAAGYPRELHRGGRGLRHVAFIGGVHQQETEPLGTTRLLKCLCVCGLV
jgi:hypothetical protein